MRTRRRAGAPDGDALSVKDNLAIAAILAVTGAIAYGLPILLTGHPAHEAIWVMLWIVLMVITVLMVTVWLPAITKARRGR